MASSARAWVGSQAATHSYAIVAAANGALIDRATFPTTAAGLRRARDWIGRRGDGIYSSRQILLGADER